MSQSNWRFTLNTGQATTFIGGTSGSAVQHINLPNPITSSGLWCRGFYGSSNGGNRAATSMVPIDNSELTSSSGYTYGYGYSMRMWVRMDNISAGVNNCGYSLIFKGKSDLDINFTSPWVVQNTGYYLTFDNSVPGLIKLMCRNEAGVATDSVLTPNANGFQKNMFYMTASVWKRIRMDVTPISGAFDKISIYTGSQIEGDWSMIDSVEIPRTKTGAYIPWANNPNGDGAAASGKGYMGITAFSNNVTFPVYIDGFEVYRETITV
ncbi:MAG: hypothetical protein RLZZ196_3651 [Bacteroidota bacterium]|jgi:hypothetical protein